MRKQTLQRDQIHFLIVTLLVFSLAVLMTTIAHAQTTCPPGYEWQRMSGVGCVQINCGEIANAKYSYTKDCICQDGYKGCYQPIDYSGFDQSLCGPNCPYSTLISCIPPDATCPNEEPALPPTSEPALTVPPSEQNPFIDTPPSSSTEEEDFEDFISILEEFVTGGHTHTASSGQEAAGGMTATALLTAWVLINLLSGGNPADLLSNLVGSAGNAPSGGPAQTQMSPPPSLSTSGQTNLPPSQSPGGQTAEAADTILPQSGNQTVGAEASTPPPSKETGISAPAEPPPPRITDPTKFQQAITDKYTQILQDKVKDNYYVRNPDFIHKAWNNFPIISSLSEAAWGLKGGQCAEFADWGHGWIKPWAEQAFGPGVIVDSIWIGESSSRYPEGFLESADALIQANHTANRITLPNGDSYIVDFWDGMIKQRDGSPESIKDIQVLSESDWVIKWRDKIETDGDPADICNLNKYQESLRQHISSFDAKHPSLASASSPERWQENNELVERAIQDWMNTSNYPPEIKQTIVQNWRKNGSTWGMYRPDPPLDPASAVFDSYYQLTD